MRKSLAELGGEQRSILLYVVDLGTAISASGLIVSLLKLIVDSL